jgi:hypothetical protein
MLKAWKNIEGKTMLESKTQVGNDRLVVKFASCINADGGYVTMDGNIIDVSRNNFEILFTMIRYGKKPGSITYLGCSRNHSYYEVEVSSNDWETLNDNDDE